MSDDLRELERRVGEKWAAAATARIPERELPVFDIHMSAWQNLPPLPPGTPQFPREQWASYPARRTAALLAADRMLDFDELTDEQWMDVCLVMQYGGKTRIA